MHMMSSENGEICGAGARCSASCLSVMHSLLFFLCQLRSSQTKSAFLPLSCPASHRMVAVRNASVLAFVSARRLNGRARSFVICWLTGLLKYFFAGCFLVHVDAVRCSLAFAIRFPPCRVHAAKWLHCLTVGVRAWTFTPSLHSRCKAPRAVSCPVHRLFRCPARLEWVLRAAPAANQPFSTPFDASNTRRGAKTVLGAHDAESASLLNSIFRWRRHWRHANVITITEHKRCRHTQQRTASHCTALL
ncbi:hypothetical protein GQ600_16617 [Phytophthora cactorum]|nr:hypothetical protein GQ600_16617 [Phytophthora cactorum]